jgi:hypothetical protein
LLYYGLVIYGKEPLDLKNFSSFADLVELIFVELFYLSENSNYLVSSLELQLSFLRDLISLLLTYDAC